MTISYIVEQAEDEGQRADVVLGRRIAGLSRRIARKLALEGALRVDGERAPPSHRVRRGNRLDVTVRATASAPVAPEILAVTASFVYANKPAGIHTHRLRPDEDPSLADAVAVLHPECRDASAEPRECGAVHRLDRDTSGVVVLARSREAWESARAGFADGKVTKLYLAVCAAAGRTWPPHPPSGEPGAIAPAGAVEPSERALVPIASAVTIRAPLGPGPSRDRVAVRSGGQAAETIVWPLAWAHAEDPAWPTRLLCALELRTGRRHQARAHLAWAGLWVLGDSRYGPVPQASNALMLHARQIDLAKACPGERAVTAPLPTPFRHTLAGLVIRAI